MTFVGLSAIHAILCAEVEIYVYVDLRVCVRVCVWKRRRDSKGALPFVTPPRARLASSGNGKGGAT